MRPLRQWLAVRRIETRANSRLILPREDLAEAAFGIVQAVGDGIECKGRGVRPHDCRPGDRIVYSARIDEYQTRHEGKVDLIEEASIIGKFYG